jgi:4-amino-4-deoxy-L-arabinose transferase-like glycosyltransferase
MYNIHYVNIFVLILALWTIPWKIYAVWLAAKHNQKKWFVALLILNTVAIMEIFYIFKIAKKSWDEVKEDFRKALSSLK